MAAARQGQARGAWLSRGGFCLPLTDEISAPPLMGQLCPTIGESKVLEIDHTFMSERQLERAVKGRWQQSTGESQMQPAGKEVLGKLSCSGIITNAGFLQLNVGQPSEGAQSFTKN